MFAPVAAKDLPDLYNFGDELNGWWVLAQRWNPFAKPLKIPNMNEVFFLKHSYYCDVFAKWLIKC